MTLETTFYRRLFYQFDPQRY